MKNKIQNLLAKGYVKWLKNTDFLVVLGQENKEVTAKILKDMLNSNLNVLVISSIGEDLASKVLKLKRHVDLVIVTLNPDRDGAVDAVIRVIKPMMVVLTAMSRLGGDDVSYREYLGRLKRLILSMQGEGVVIVNNDDSDCKLLVSQDGVNSFYYGVGKLENGLWASNVRIESFHTRYELNLGVERSEVYSNLLGSHMVYPQLAASAAAIYLGVPLTSIKNSLESIDEFPRQMQVVGGLHGSVIINDTKEMTLNNLEGALDVLDKVNARKRILVTTGVFGISDSEKQHQKIARRIFKQELDYCFFLGREGKMISEELSNLGFAAEKLEDDLTASQIVNKLAKLVGRGDVILVKGKEQNIEEIVVKLIKD